MEHFGHLRHFLVTVACLVTTATLQANMRAPGYRDRALSGSPGAPPTAGRVYLMNERLRIQVLPLSGASDVASISVWYELDNRGEFTRLAVVFLATGITRPRIRVNEQPPERYALGRERGVDWPDYLERLAEHRATWHPEMYPDGSGRAGELGSAEAVAELEHMAFDLELRPGKNVLHITYEQPCFLNERATGGSFHWDEAIWGVDYLLYPARSWQRAAGFELDVGITVADFQEQVWWWTNRYQAEVESNLKLTSKPDRHGIVLEGKFGEMPADILSFVVTRGARR